MTDMGAMWGEEASNTDVEDPKLQWLREETYSMFIHWGLYSLLGGEWQGKTYYGIGEWIMHPAMAGIPVDEYRQLAKRFNPTSFDAKAIVRLARDAGMRCIVITAKHHEGFAMFDSKASDFTIASTPFGRDIMHELAKACQKEGIRLGFYYSQFQDWVEPDGGGSMCPPLPGVSPDFDRYFENKVVPQVTELLSNYGPIAVVWFDTPGRMGPEYSQRLVDLVHKFQPDCLVNSRVGNGLGDYSTLGDMELPTLTPDDGVYECIDTTNDSWSFSRYDSHWKSPRTIAQSLVRTIARGCSFMLNVGPTAEGDIPDEAVRGLRGAGKWVDANSEAIYRTTASPFPPFSWGDCTVKESCLYLHIFDWPNTRRLQLAALSGCVTKAEILPTGVELCFDQSDDLLTLNVSEATPDPIITVIRLTLDMPPAAIHQDVTVYPQYSTCLLAEYAETQGVTLQTMRWMEMFGEWKKTENLTGWHTKHDSKAVWHLNVLKPGTYSVTVEYACTPEAEGSEWQLEIDDEVLVFQALETGMSSEESGGRKRMRYRAVERGVLNLKRPGRQTLRMSPRFGSVQADIWVRTITLQPW